MRYIILCAFLTFSFVSFSQTKAVTEDGKTVLLNDDGTWEWQSVKTDTTVSVSKSKDVESDRFENYFTESERLDRYFSNPQNKIRGSSTCVIEGGVAKIKFLWEVYLGDGNRYFGYLKEGTKVSLITNKGEKIDLTLNENVNTELKEKFNVTIFTGTCSLNQQQLSKICNTSIKSIEVFWKKKSEVYALKDVNAFKKAFDSIISQN